MAGKDSERTPEQDANLRRHLRRQSGKRTRFPVSKKRKRIGCGITALATLVMVSAVLAIVDVSSITMLFFVWLPAFFAALFGQ